MEASGGGGTLEHTIMEAAVGGWGRGRD